MTMRHSHTQLIKKKTNIHKIIYSTNLYISDREHQHLCQIYSSTQSTILNIMQYRICLHQKIQTQSIQTLSSLSNYT